ncbi:MAG: hypothetical protein RSA01_01175 [Clostridium sp.]
MEVVNCESLNVEVGGWVGCAIGCTGGCLLTSGALTATMVAVYLAT